MFIINTDEHKSLGTFLGSCQPIIVLAVTILLTIYGIFCRIISASSIHVLFWLDKTEAVESRQNSDVLLIL